MAVTPVVGAGYIEAVQSIADALDAGTAVPAATTSVAGVVKQAAITADFAGADAAAIVVELNAFLAKLRTAGIVAV